MFVCRHKKYLVGDVANITLELRDYFTTCNFMDAFYEF